MTFEEWMEIHAIRHSTGQDPVDEGLILADWKAEREQVEIALLATRQQRDDEFNRAEKLEAERENLIGISKEPVEAYAPRLRWRSHIWDKARAVLAEVKEGVCATSKKSVDTVGR